MIRPVSVLIYLNKVKLANRIQTDLNVISEPSMSNHDELLRISIKLNSLRHNNWINQQFCTAGSSEESQTRSYNANFRGLSATLNFLNNVTIISLQKEVNTIAEEK